MKNFYELFFSLLSSFKYLFILKNEKNSLAQYLKIGLAVIFSVLYLPHAFILIQDINLISAFEVDPGSIIASINDLFNMPMYNMLNGYHSKFYGWTYFSINFLLLTPLKILLYLFGIKSQTPILFAIKIIYFSIGLLMTLAFYEVLNKLSRNRFLIINFLFSFLFVASSVHYVFYFIHPESTGALFIFLGISTLLLFIKESKLLLYYTGVIFLVMASLAKQTFFIAALPIFFCFLDVYRRSININSSSFVTSTHLFKLLKNTFYLSLFIFFIIHPYAFFKPIAFLSFQHSLALSFSANGEVSYIDSIYSWINFLKYNHLMYFSFWSLFFVIPFAFYKYKKTNHYEYFLTVMNGIAAIFIFLFVAYGNRLVFFDNYLFPCYLFLFFNIFVISHFLIIKTRNYKFVFFNEFFHVAFISLFSYFIFTGMKATLTDSLTRLNYKNSIAFRSYDYIKSNIKNGDKIAHDHFVAVPDYMNNISCHFWRGCGTDFIEEFNPNYVIFNPNFSFNGKSIETQRLEKYVKDHNMILAGKISSLQFNIVDVGISNNDNTVSILIYKKRPIK